MMFSKTLRRLRLDKKLTQSDMAKALDISRVAYTNYELGNREPDFNTTAKIAAILGTSVDYLLGISPAFQLNEKNIQSYEGLSPSLRLVMLSARDLSKESCDDLQKYVELLKLKDEKGPAHPHSRRKSNNKSTENAPEKGN